MQNLDVTKYGFVKTSKKDETPITYTLKQKKSTLELEVDEEEHTYTLTGIVGKTRHTAADSYIVNHQSELDFLIFNSKFFAH